MMYSDVRKKHGNVAGKAIRDEKRKLQDELDKNPNPEILPWILAHPDLPGSEAAGLIMNNASTQSKRLTSPELNPKPLDPKLDPRTTS